MVARMKMLPTVLATLLLLPVSLPGQWSYKETKDEMTDQTTQYIYHDVTGVSSRSAMFMVR
jgi:hypothetical protein